MSWLNTVLTVGNSMMLASQVHKLHELEQQQSDMAAIVAVIAILRHQIFRYNQVTKEVLAQQDREPKLALASLKLFQYEMSQAGLKPENFIEIADKEYCAATQAMIADGISALNVRVDQRDRKTIDDAIQAMAMLPDYEFYLDEFEAVQVYQENLDLYNRLKGRTGGLATVLRFAAYIFVVWPMLGGVCSFLVGGVLAMIGSGAGMAGATSDEVIFGSFFGGACLGYMLATVLTGVLAFYIENNYARRQEFNAIKADVEHIENDIDLERFQRLKQVLGSDLAHVRELKRQAEAKVRKLGDSQTLLASLPA